MKTGQELPAGSESTSLRANFRRVERREWWLWGSALTITLLVTFGLASFLLVGSEGPLVLEHGEHLSEIVRGLVALIFIFDLYTLYQQVQIYRIRKQLIYREELFHLISENAADMIAVVDMEGNRLYNSLSYEKVLGYTIDELQSSFSLEQVHPEDREFVRDAAEESRRTGEGKTLEYRFRHKNGHWLNLESTSSVIRNAQGEPEKLVIVNRDITKRKLAEDAFRRSQADFRSLIEHAPYGIYRATTDGRLLQVNQALTRMLGYESNDQLSSCDVERDIFRYPGEYRRLTEMLSRTREIKDAEAEWQCKDGSYITVRFSCRLIDNRSGLPPNVELFADDVTEKKVLERQLRMAQKMEAVGRLSGGIAHDFNNLLSVVLGYSRMLKKQLHDKPMLADYANEIENAGNRAASLTRQLLAFSRQQILTPVVLDLNNLVTDMEKMLPRLLGEDVKVVVKLGRDLGKLKADQSQIEQVVMNLAINARDAMPGGGTLEISTQNVSLDETYTRTHPGSKTGKYVVLAVSDTGIGMNAETLAHIFEPFFTTKEVGRGTGLGLATVYGVVKQSNGYIAVESSPGHGACFQIYLPLYEGAVDVAARPTGRSEGLVGSERILLVEDSEPLRRLAKTVLEAAGFQLTVAKSAEHALEIAEASPKSFDLLLTDVVMPGMNGRGLAERLQPRHPGLRVLYMSGYTDSFIAGHCPLEPWVRLLQKPFTEEVLIEKVREVLDERIRDEKNISAGSAAEIHATQPM